MDMIKLPLARIPTFSTFFQKCANDTQEDDDDYNEIQLWSIKVFFFFLKKLWFVVLP